MSQVQTLTKPPSAGKAQAAIEAPDVASRLARLQEMGLVPESPGLELPTEDGIPMESPWHVANMNLLIDVLRYHWRERSDYFCGGNMFIYFSLDQAYQVIDEIARDVVPPPDRRAYRGPDFFVVLGVDGTRPRDSWIVWKEGGRYPNVIVELQSPSTASYDEGRKKELYEQTFRTPDYFCVDRDNRQIKGWRLSGGRYQPLEPNERGHLWSEELGLWLGWWEGSYQEKHDHWARFFDGEGNPIPTRAEAEARRAEAAEAEVARLRALLAQAGVDSGNAGLSS